jgi:ABC-type branched-subunit amino acid transport system ATPase component
VQHCLDAVLAQCSLDESLFGHVALDQSCLLGHRRPMSLGQRIEDGHAVAGGQQKLVEFGACFMSRPKLVVLDEPFAAIHVTIRQVMLEVIGERHRDGQAFLVVSHDIPAIMRLCPRTVCMNAGAVIADGVTEAVMREPQVVEAYLGSHPR